MLTTAIDCLSCLGITLEPLLNNPEVRQGLIALLDDRISTAQFVALVSQVQKKAVHSATNH